jgi:hypothetical protein
MFAAKKLPTRLETRCEEVLAELADHKIASEEYGVVLDRAVKLHKMKTEEESSPVSKDTLVLAGTNLLGILMVIGYEHHHVITSSAMRMIQKPR